VVGERLPMLESWHCFGCDPNHDKGLRLTFKTAGENRLRTEVTLTGDYVGVDSIIHGGIIATIFDDVMMWCLLRFQNRFYVTARMEQRLQRPVFAGVPLVAEAAIEEEHSDGRVRLSARLWAQDDPETILAEGTGLFIETPAHLLDLIPDDQRSEMERLFEQCAAASI
jgi:acyl-coenzyme A thioesterase PaaI-like protein